MQLNMKLWLNFLIWTTTFLVKCYGYDYKNPPQCAMNPSYMKVQSNGRYKDMIPIFEVINLEFGFPSEAIRNAALASGEYDPDNPIPIDMDVYYQPGQSEPIVFITIPRFGTGVPYSLATLTNIKRPNGTEIQPFPNYLWHKSHGRNCDGLTSVYRIQIDPCGHMWILDSGEIEFKQYCAPQVVVLDIPTGRLLHRYRLPKKVYKPGVSRFVTPLVDIEDPPPIGTCSRGFVYMADVTGTSLIVYDIVKGDSWRIENKYTYPDPDFGTHTVAGESFELMDGVLGLTVTPRGATVRRMLYFHALSNDAQVAVPLDVINNSSNWGYGLGSSLDQFKLLGKRGVQCGASAMTSNGFLICGYLDPIAMVAWDVCKPYTPSNQILLAENPTTLQFVSGLKVKRTPQGKEELWMLSNRLQKAFSGTTNYKEINYRIQKCGIDELFSGKPCTY